MSQINSWIERVYGETDFGRSVATSLAGIVGLAIYLAFGDWIVAAFSAVIAFPIARLASTGLYEKVRRGSSRRLETERARIAYEGLSPEEKNVVAAFAKAGGSVLTWSQANHLELSAPAIESLVQRELIGTSVTADGMRETFVLDTALFDIGLRALPKNI